ncbi:MAG TPA: hypothetical protein VNH41_12125 [Steroidobacteraceae bacterium]|nr:hypothetical protein [Steroidobacteraceae bacterium]
MTSGEREILAMWVVYERPRDFPHSFVIRRRMICTDGRELVDPVPLAVGPTLEAVRRALPPGLHRMPRHPLDEPQIAEVWL